LKVVVGAPICGARQLELGAAILALTTKCIFAHHP